MSLMHSWCERLFLVSLIVVISIFLADYKFYFLPINGIYLVLYVLLIIVTTIWITCIDIQKLLQKTVPFEYDFETNRHYKKFKQICKFLQIPLQATTKLSTLKVKENISRTPIVEKRDFLDARPINFPIANQSKLPPSTDPIKEKSIDERIEILVNDIEQKFISKWYNLISEEDAFSAESKILLEGIIRRVLQVSVQMDSSKLLCGILVIVLKHLKEYRKAVKRVSKIGGSVESVYRYSHIGNKSESALEHFTHRLTANVLREFISWELWNSLPCRLLVSILSKRLTTYIIYYVAQPGWINYKILYQTSSKTEILHLKLDDYSYISLSDVDLSDHTSISDENVKKNGKLKLTMKDNEKVSEKSVSSTPKMSPKKDGHEMQLPSSDASSKNSNTNVNTLIQSSESVIEQALTKMIAQQTAPILQRAEKSSVDGKSPEKDVSSPTSTTQDSQKLEASFKPKRSEPVKIHSAKSSSKTWDETELSNISIGQDLLALEALEGTGIQGFSGRRLWGYNTDLNEQDVEKPNHPLWEINETWLKDKDSVEKEVDDVVRTSPKNKQKRKDVKDLLKSASPPSSSIPHCFRPATTSASAFVTNTIKPIAGNVTATTLHNMRELQQSTVNVMKPVSNATEKAIHKIGDLQDEAVGVVEGIFDFGMAGIRKGLRLTGLQDNNTDIPPKPTKPVIHQEPVKHSPKTVPKLVKLGHVTSASEDNKPVIKKVTTAESDDSCWINPLAKDSPNGYENQMLLENSPNLVETDSSVIIPDAEVPIIDPNNLFLVDSPEYEETADLASTISKLRSLLQQKSSESSLNTPAVSPMPIDDKSCPTPSEPVITDITKGDGGMQRFARTVTGMFNTFKTALPGNANEQSNEKNEQWIFIENETSETDLPSLLNSLLVERRDYCTVDTAYEAMDSLDLLTESVSSQAGKIQWDTQIYEDELDDLDTSIPITKALLDVICECMKDTKCALNQEPVMKALLIIAGSISEKKLNQLSEKLLRYINRAIGPLPKNDSDNVLAMNLDKLVTSIENYLPYYIREIFGYDDIKTGLKFLMSSLQSVKINQDIILQVFELISSQLIYASSQMSPTPSA